MTHSLLYRYYRWAQRHPWVDIAVWIVVPLTVGVTLGTLLS